MFNIIAKDSIIKIGAYQWNEIGACLIIFFLLNGVATHNVSHPPNSSNWRYSGYHLAHGSDEARSFKFATDVPNTYRSASRTAKDRWNRHVSSITLRENSNAKNNVYVVEKMTGDYFALHRRISNEGQHIHRWSITYNTSKMDKLSITDKQAVASHEFGHALGLAHIVSEYQLMRSNPTSKYGIKIPSVDENRAVNNLY